ncbi:MAG TPA: outer membrane beta-barrel protein [Steroidobacteraceae bacterium]|nr:outer membrane beta-barrel protein [Steroidobacteraceae bacterium]
MRKFLLLPVLALAAASAHADDAADTNVYAGAGITSADVQNIEGTGFNIDNTSVKALAGLRFSLIGAEVDYYRLGNDSRNFYFGGANADAHAFAAYAVGYLPLPILDFFGKVGVDRWQLNGSSTNASLFQFSDSGTQFAWGLGAQEHFGNFLARVEYEHLAMSYTDGARVISLDVAYTFDLF